MTKEVSLSLTDAEFNRAADALHQTEALFVKKFHTAAQVLDFLSRRSVG